MQVNLVFGPFAKPRIPLGIALLKSYVEQNSNFQIKCFDLNALYHNDLCDDVGSNNSHVNISEQDKETLMEAVNVFKGGNEEFFNQAVYDRSASTLFQGCFERSNGFFDSELPIDASLFFVAGIRPG